MRKSLLVALGALLALAAAPSHPQEARPPAPQLRVVEQQAIISPYGGVLAGTFRSMESPQWDFAPLADGRVALVHGGGWPEGPASDPRLADNIWLSLVERDRTIVTPPVPLLKATAVEFQLIRGAAGLVLVVRDLEDRFSCYALQPGADPPLRPLLPPKPLEWWGPPPTLYLMHRPFSAAYVGNEVWLTVVNLSPPEVPLPPGIAPAPRGRPTVVISCWRLRDDRWQPVLQLPAPEHRNSGLVLQALPDGKALLLAQGVLLVIDPERNALVGEPRPLEAALQVAHLEVLEDPPALLLTGRDDAGQSSLSLLNLPDLQPVSELSVQLPSPAGLRPRAVEGGALITYQRVAERIPSPRTHGERITLAGLHTLFVARE